MIKAVIFDMDGVMIETEPLQSKSFEHVLRNHGVEPEFNKDGVIQKVGVTARDNLVMLKEKHGIDEDVDTLLAQKRAAYDELLRQNLFPKEGLLPLIKTLKEGGLKLAVASSSSLEQIQLVLHGLAVSGHFDGVVSGEDLPRGKPHPDIFLETARKLGIDPIRCLVLEDAESGVEAARAAHMKVIAVPNRYTQSHSFHTADAVVSSLQDVTWPLISRVSTEHEELP